MPVSIPSWVWDELREWKSKAPHLGEDDYDDHDRNRLGEIVLRVALISASANRDKSITKECLAAAFKFGQWQETIKYNYRPSRAENKDAEIENAIIDAFKEQGIGKYVRFRELLHKKNWSRKYGSPNVTRVKRAMVDEGILDQQMEHDGNGKETKKATGKYALVVG